MTLDATEGSSAAAPARVPATTTAAAANAAAPTAARPTPIPGMTPRAASHVPSASVRLRLIDPYGSAHFAAHCTTLTVPAGRWQRCADMLARSSRVALAGIPSCALVVAVMALSPAGCGDDTVALLPDGATSDATVDGTVGDDGGADTGCTPYDASHLDPTAVQAGRALALALKCPKCHGDTFSGTPNGVQSPQTEGGLAYPPNLTPDPTTGLGCWTDDQIENAFLHGIDDQGQPLCPPMPRFADAGVDASGAGDLLAFLRSLPPVSLQVPNTPDCKLGPVGDDGGPDASEAGADASDAGTDARDAGVDAAEAGVDASDAGVVDANEASTAD
jgi:hypothetical protein